MSATHGSRLWPIMVALAAILTSAAVLEVYARSREPQAIVVELRQSSVTSFDDDEAEGTGASPEADSSQPINAAHAQARELGRRGDAEGAIRALREQLTGDPERAVLHADLGYYLLVTDHVSDAVDELSRARTLDAKNPTAFMNLGIALRRSGDLQGAEAALTQALALKPSLRGAKLALAVLMCAQKRWDAAMPVFDELVKTGGNAARASALLAQGRAWLQQGKGAAAERSFNAAIEWMPAQADVRVAVARAFLAAGGAENLARARNVAEIAVQLAPDIAETHGALGRAQELASEIEAAEQSYQVALKLDPDFHYARRRLLRIALGRQDYAAAQAHAERLLALSPSTAEHHFLAGLVSAHAGKPDEARAHYAAAISASHDGYPEAYFNLGLLEKDEHHFAEAIEAYKQAIAHRPDYLSAWNNLALVYAASGDDKQAEDTYRKALAIDVRYWQGWANLGKLELRQKRFPEAIQAFERAAAIHPSATEPLLNLGVAYRRAGRVNDAVATYRKLVASAPRYVSAWFNLGVALRHAGKLREAREAYEHALLLDETHEASQRNLAELLLNGGELDAAAQRYEGLLDQKPDDREARLGLADIKRRKGDAVGCAHLVRAAVPTSDTTLGGLVARCTSREQTASLQL